MGKRKSTDSRKSRNTRSSKSRKGYSRTEGLYGRFVGPEPEDKFYDTELTNVNLLKAGAIIKDTLVPTEQGDTASKVNGRMCTIVSVNVKAEVHMVHSQNAAPANFKESCRVALVYDTQCNGTAPAVADIYTTLPVATTPTIHSQINLAKSKRFKILKEWVYDFTPTDNIVDGSHGLFSNVGAIKQIVYWRKLSIPITYDMSASAGINRVESNNLLLVGFCKTNNKVQFSGTIRVRYADQ